ncbi:hypothetical protein LOK49_Contig180G00020 [Camellia lanceoleosa]|nr:hypothetical protein LOK49_Contig180G00020 [Camellia lanceoleosa]
MAVCCKSDASLLASFQRSRSQENKVVTSNFTFPSSADVRTPSAFFLLSLLFLFVNFSNARNDPADYWKSMMKGKPIPKAIEEVVHGDSSSSETINMEHFNKAFDSRPNHILYHGHIVKEDFKQGHEIDSDQGEMIQSSVKPVKPRIKFAEYNQAQKDHIYMHFLYR